MKILGVDPGLLNLGCVLISVKDKKLTILRGETFKPPQAVNLNLKLHYLYTNFKDFLETDTPDLVVIEDYLAMANPKTSAKLAQAQAIVLLLATEKGCPLKLYHPSFWKSCLCGNGKASKKEIKRALNTLFGREIDAKIKNEHMVDALGLALVGALELKLL